MRVIKTNRIITQLIEEPSSTRYARCVHMYSADQTAGQRDNSYLNKVRIRLLAENKATNTSSLATKHWNNRTARMGTLEERCYFTLCFSSGFRIRLITLLQTRSSNVMDVAQINTSL